VKDRVEVDMQAERRGFEREEREEREERGEVFPRRQEAARQERRKRSEGEREKG
jgi:hypothetical protein